ncbi:MAG: AraC family transcriptional regulator ligand-binding domain-containing protein [Pseudomonadota bacterium]
MSADPVLSLARYSLRCGMPRDRIESLIGVSLGALNPGNPLPAIAGPTLFAQVLEEGLGVAPAIEVAQGAPFSFFSGLEGAVQLAPTGRAGLQALVSYFDLFHNGLIAALDETKTYTRFSIRFPGIEFDNGCCNEVVMGVLVRLMRSVFRADGQPHEVRLRFDRNGVRTAYEDFFQAPVRFHCEDQSYSLVWRKSNVEHHRSAHEHAAFRKALGQLEQRAARRQSGSEVADFMELVSAVNVCANMGFFSVERAATKAGMGGRTAQRVAQRQGTSVGKLIERARLRLLREQVMRDPTTSAEDLSGISGFSDSRALRRAIKSWTGQPLVEFRIAPYAGTTGE